MTSPLPLPQRFDLTRSSQPSAATAGLDQFVLYGVFTLLLCGPLAFGAVEPWAVLVLKCGAAALFLVWCLGQAAAGTIDVKSSPLFPPMLAFAALIVLQLVFGQTAYRYATISRALLYAAYGMLCFLVVQCLRKAHQVKTLATVISAYGFAVATFAMLQGISSSSKLYWLRTPRSGGWIYGPYVNHNHYAGLVELLLPVPLVFAFSHYATPARKAAAATSAAIMASTIFLSGSRGGMLALAVQMVFFGVVALRQRKSGRPVLALGVFAAVAVAVLVWLGGGELTRRLASIHAESRVELSGGTRVSMLRDGLKMSAHRPILGWGLGVFADVYPQFRSFYTNFYVDHAHDDYLELLVEMGALGFLIMLWFLVQLYRRAFAKLRDAQLEMKGAVTLAAILGVTGILVHSFFDFNLQIPANAALFYVMCCVAAMEPRFGFSGRRRTIAGNFVAAERFTAGVDPRADDSGLA